MQIGCGAHVLWHKAKEVSNTNRRLKDAATLEAKLIESLVHGFDGHRAGVVRIEDGLARSLPFLFGQQILQFGVLLRPLLIVRIEDAFQRTPSDILRNFAALFGGG